MMRNTGVVVLLLCMGLSPAGWARTYLVSTSGDDANPGTEEEPFRTIGKAASVMKADDTAIVAAGTYPERIPINRSGKQGSPITFQAWGQVVMQGFTLTANYIHIVGFEITNKAREEYEGAGVYLMGSGNEILNNYIHDLYFQGILFQTKSGDKVSGTEDNLVVGNHIVRSRFAGIHIEGRNNRIEENDISHTLQYPKGAPQAEEPDADGIRFFGTGNLIRRNSIHDILLGDQGNRNPHIDCFQTWGPASTITFDGNFCDNPNTGQQGWMISSDGNVHRLTMRNNVVKAFRLMNINDAPWVTVVNNSFKGELTYPDTSERGYGVELKGSPNARVQNNLFHDIGGHVDPYITVNKASKKGLIVGYNAVYMSDGKRPAGAPYAKDLWQKNPRVTDPMNLDFRLKPDSPLIDAGETLADVKWDREDVTRPQRTRHDIGAYELAP
jgi:parallel beta-helix repeat protein